MTELVAMAKARRFEDVVVWQKAHAFVLDVYGLSGRFPKEERFGLTSQFRRAAVSIAANFAEGFRKAGIADKMRFFNISQGSVEECRYYLILARDLGYADTSAIENRLDEVSRMLEAYSKSLKRNHPEK
jgi:four helix bundle protein